MHLSVSGGPRQRFSVDRKHFVRFRGENAVGLVWTENRFYIFKYIWISVDGALTRSRPGGGGEGGGGFWSPRQL